MELSKLWIGGYPRTVKAGSDLEAQVSDQLPGILEVAIDGHGHFTDLRRLADLPQPSFLAAHPSGKHLYAVQETDPGWVTALEVGESGALGTPVTVPSHGSSPCHITALEDSIWIANYGDGVVTRYPVTANYGEIDIQQCQSFTGSTKLGPKKDRQDSAHAHYCLPVGDRVLIMDLGSDLIRAFPNDGSYNNQAVDLAHLPPGTGPRHAVLLENNHLAVVGELDGKLHLLAPKGDGWDNYYSVPLLEPNGEITQADIANALPSHITKTGDLLIIGIRKVDVLVTFRITQDGAAASNVEPLGIIPLGKGTYPRHHVVVGNTENGNILVVVATQYANELTSVEIDPVTGQGRVIERFALPVAPRCLLLQS